MNPSHILLCALVAALPSGADAQPARAGKWINVRAGPARDYPLVASVGPGTPLSVQGCTAGYAWCDVIVSNGVRGWVYAGNIVYPYQRGEVPVIGYGALIGLPIVGFTAGHYWGRHYRDRPWYGSWPRYQHHGLPGPGGMPLPHPSAGLPRPGFGHPLPPLPLPGAIRPPFGGGAPPLPGRHGLPVPPLPGRHALPGPSSTVRSPVAGVPGRLQPHVQRPPGGRGAGSHHGERSRRD